MKDNITHIGLTSAAIKDLDGSGLEPPDIGARMIGPAEMAATKTSSVQGRPPYGYVIPYFNMVGEAVKFYRIKLLETGPDGVKYRQPIGEPNHLYFPPRFKDVFIPKTSGFVLITEGEKKAACAVKMGLPCVAVSGVDSWRNRRILLPKDTELTQNKQSGLLTARIPRGTNQDVVTESYGALALGLPEFIDTLVQHQIPTIIVYDTDDDGKVKVEVQRAAATLGYELRYRGLPITLIRQIVLPAKGKKVGLDDYLVKQGKEEFTRIINTCLKKRCAFPRHPNPIAYIGSRLQKKQLSRKETQDVALSILAELEARGRRFRTEGSDQLHYFDEQTRTLYPVQLNNQRIPLHETAFGSYVYRQFNLGGADKRVVEWLATQFSGEPPIDSTETQQVIALVKEPPFRGCLAYQTGDSTYAIITPQPEHPVVMQQNGSHGILFEQGQVENLDTTKLEQLVHEHLFSGPKMLWRDVFGQLNVKATTSEEGESRATDDQMRTLVSLLYYISPWLKGREGTQLPIELTIGEAGSGKSSLLSLRQRIVTGKSYLSNVTTDMRDWWAGITSRGGVYVMDNVHFSGKKADFRQQLSDEICRLITEPNPHVEMRKLYSTNTVISLAVRPTFAVTSIEQPFYNSDLLQRALVFELEAIQRGHDSEWVNRQLRNGGGRIGWVANHLAALHKFLQLVTYGDQWDPNYQAHHRLANYEQSLRLMARVFKIDDKWIPDVLVASTEEQLSDADWIYRALGGFVQHHKAKDKEFEKRRWSVQEIAGWMSNHEAYNNNPILTNAWRLGRYMQSHKKQLERSIGLYQAGKKANRFVYGIYRRKEDE